MKKIIIFVIVWALLIVGGRFAVFRILDQKSNEAFDSLHQFSTMLGMPVKIKYRKVFVDLDGSIGFEGVRVSSPQTGYTKIDRISYSNGSLLNLTRLLWHVSRISQAESATERESRSKNLFSSSALWRQQIIRSEGVVGFASGIEICGANFTGTVLTAPVNAEFRWDANKDTSDGVVKFTAELPGLADYEFTVSAAMMDLPGLSSIDGVSRSSTRDRSMAFELTQVVEDLSIITAITNHCAEQRGGSPEDVRQIAIQGLNEYMEKQTDLDNESNLQVLAGLEQSWREPGVLKISGIFDAQAGGYEQFDPVSFNGTIVNTSRVINQVRSTTSEAQTSQKENVESAEGKKQKPTGIESRWVARPVSELRTYVDSKVRVTSVTGEVHNGRLTKVDETRYLVTIRTGSGEYGSYAPIKKIEKLEVWESK
ncbi:MAG TPA: hypothetical protein EYQ32_13295 [Gammaproteobacteria bacterium]|nr:hypothetical protein [Gammaproteobacteria bacterium]